MGGAYDTGGLTEVTTAVDKGATDVEVVGAADEEEDSESELDELTAGDELAGVTEEGIEELNGRVEEAEVSGATEDEAVLDGATS